MGIFSKESTHEIARGRWGRLKQVRRQRHRHAKEKEIRSGAGFPLLGKNDRGKNQRQEMHFISFPESLNRSDRGAQQPSYLALSIPGCQNPQRTSSLQKFFPWCSFINTSLFVWNKESQYLALRCRGLFG